METFAPYITAITAAVVIMALLWIGKQTKRIDSVHFLFGSGIMLYVIYHFYAVSTGDIFTPTYIIISNLFIASVALANAYYSTCVSVKNIVTIRSCRRKVNTHKLVGERRAKHSHTLFSESLKQ